ncbi:hypothetical protein ABZP36_001843 [Zizania latifolia]
MGYPAYEPASAEPRLAEESAAAAAAAGDAVVVVDVEKEAAEGEEEEEEEGECGFCLFMKGGGCKEAFVAWEECVEAAETEGSDMVERCFQATANLKKCMDAHADYYAPVLQAEQAVSDHAEAAIAADAAPSPSSNDDKKVEAAAQDAASAADEKREEVDEKAASSLAAIDERKEKELVTEKAES